MARKPKPTDIDAILDDARADVAATESALVDAREANAAAHARLRDADEAWQTQEADRRRAAHDGEPGPTQAIGG